VPLQPFLSATFSTADIYRTFRHICFVPLSDSCTRQSLRRMRRYAARGMKRTLNEIACNKFDEAAADRRHRENPHGDKVREVSAAFAES